MKSKKVGKFCKICGVDVSAEFGIVEESQELVAVLDATGDATILNKGDHICTGCNSKLDFYRRVKYPP